MFVLFQLFLTFKHAGTLSKRTYGVGQYSLVVIVVVNSRRFITEEFKSSCNDITTPKH